MMFPAVRQLPRSEAWSLFDWFGRCCDQAAGILLSPLILVIYARSLEDDPYRLSFFVSGFIAAWLLGSAAGPLLQRITIRVMPWIIGGFVVRTAAIALLAYSASDRQSPADERFQSALICIIAYGVATGISRSAEAQHLRNRPTDEPVYLRSLMGTTGTSIIVAIGAWAAWSVLSVGTIPWYQAFARLWTLAAIALGVASLAALLRASSIPELPVRSDRFQGNSRPSSPSTISVAGLISLGLGILIMAEALGLLMLFSDFRRDSLYVRAGLAWFILGWAAGLPLVSAVLNRYSPALILQGSIGISIIAIVGALSLRDVSGTDGFPATLWEADTVKITIYAVSVLLGLAAVGRRTAMQRMTEIEPLRPGWVALLVGLVGAAMPMLYTRWTDGVSLDLQLLIGVIVGVGVLIVTGVSMQGRAYLRSPAAGMEQSFSKPARRTS